MLIPPSVFHVFNAAALAKFSGLSLITGAHFRRLPNGQARVEATNRKVLVAVTWDEPDGAEYPLDVNGEPDLAWVPGFSAIVPYEARVLAKHKAARYSPPILSYVVLDEPKTVDGTGVHFYRLEDISMPQQASFPKIVGEYPDIEFALVVDASATAEPICYDPVLVAQLYETLLALVPFKAAKNDGGPYLTVTVQNHGNEKPTRVDLVYNGIKVAGMVMPLVTAI